MKIIFTALLISGFAYGNLTDRVHFQFHGVDGTIRQLTEKLYLFEFNRTDGAPIDTSVDPNWAGVRILFNKAECSWYACSSTKVNDFVLYDFKGNPISVDFLDSANILISSRFHLKLTIKKDGKEHKIQVDAG